MDPITTAAMTDLTLSVDAIRSGLNSLPQELYDQIYTAVFTAPVGVYCPLATYWREDFTKAHYDAVEANCKSERNQNDLKLLHISQESREIFAKSYYGHGSTFVFHDLETRLSYVSTLDIERWLLMLPNAHRVLLPKILLVRRIKKHADPLYAIAMIRDNFTRCGIEPACAANVFLQYDGKVYGNEMPN